MPPSFQKAPPFALLSRSSFVLISAMLACTPTATRVPMPPNVPSGPMLPPIDAEHPRLDWGLVIHGGAGSTSPENTPPPRRAALERAMTRALQAGHVVLARGGHSLDA